MDELEKDVRLIRRNVAKGFVSRAVVADRLADLVDVGDQADFIEIEFGEEPRARRAAEAEVLDEGAESQGS